jgi:hypothetical protein
MRIAPWVCAKSMVWDRFYAALNHGYRKSNGILRREKAFGERFLPGSRNLLTYTSNKSIISTFFYNGKL